MRTGIVISAVLIMLPWSVRADTGKTVLPLPCGIYDETVHPLVQKALKTQSNDRADYSMETTTKSGRVLRVEVANVAMYLPGERNHVSVFLDGKPLVKTSHQDVPLYLEVHVDETRYRIICVRAHEEDAGEDLMSGSVLTSPTVSPQSLITTTADSRPALRTEPIGSAPGAP